MTTFIALLEVLALLTFALAALMAAAALAKWIDRQ